MPQPLGPIVYQDPSVLVCAICNFAISAPRSSGHLSQHTLSLQHRRSLRAISQELAVTSRPPICTAGRVARAFTVSTPHSSGHLFPCTLSLQHRRSLRAVTQELAVTSRPPICTAGSQMRGLCFYRLSIQFFWPPLPAHSLHAAPLQPQGRLTKACRYQSASDLHRRPRGTCFHRLSTSFRRPPLSAHSLPAALPQPWAVSQDCVVASQPPKCPAGRQPRSPQLHRLSTPFFRLPLPAHSLPAAPSWTQGRLPRACRYQLASNLHRRPRGLHLHRLSTLVVRPAAGHVFPPGRTPN
ncbi:hypothetical protein NDU88_001270 [Pleurodeles waltl]|uniref:Uncharacterized protein n=1 Tax=Pleurodeles waltl TaxID=8319 RepID=A0AAV7W0J5_PLEWA|nr:hypothetical protein NDU88_001270 [Pleurodeles waltl]